MQPKAQVIYRKLDELKELPGNPRTIRKDQFEKLKQSLTNNADYFEARPIILSNRTGELVILAGNQRYKASKSLGMESVPTILLEGLTEEREREIIIRDNVENGDWDMDMLANEWDAGQLQDWGVELPELESITEIVEDEPPEVNEKEPAKSKLGEIYQLGNHRLMVGDSTDASQVSELMGGELADLLVTDPPYNVDYHASDGKKIQNDSFEDEQNFTDFLTDAFRNAFDSMKPGAPFYFWHASRTHASFRQAIVNCGEEDRQLLIWEKDSLVLGRSDYQWIHEPCIYGWKSGAAHYFIDDRKKTTIFHFDKPKRSEEHPTMKPIALIAELVNNSSRERERESWTSSAGAAR
jgi:site-specific DNA-methyltransferase (adenine-specific)